jgi:hypothetical protein
LVQSNEIKVRWGFQMRRDVSGPGKSSLLALLTEGARWEPKPSLASCLYSYCVHAVAGRAGRGRQRLRQQTYEVEGWGPGWRRAWYGSPNTLGTDLCVFQLGKRYQPLCAKSSGFRRLMQAPPSIWKDPPGGHLRPPIFKALNSGQAFICDSLWFAGWPKKNAKPPL